MTDESFLAAVHRRSSSSNDAAGLRDADPATALLVSTSNAVCLNRRTTKQERGA
jgi:hypothetical protein